MKTFAPSLRGAATLGLVAGLAILFGGACAGNGGGGSPAGGSGGSPTGGSSTGGSSTGGSGNGGSGTGGAAGAPGSGGRATGGAVGTGGAASGGAVGTGGGPGSGGSGQGGAAGSGGSGHCGARAGLLFCDDFESDAAGLPPATPWATSIVGAGTVTIDGSEPAASGTKSVHIQDGASASDYDTLLALHDTTILPSPTGRLYVRFYIRLAAAMTAGHNSFVLGDLFASPGDAGSLRFSEDNQMFAESIGGDAQGAMSNNNFYNDNQIGPGLTAGQWACVELLLDHVTPEIDVWLNGTEIPDLKSTAWAIDAYDDLRFGFERYAGPASEIWYDDIALGTQPIGCD